MKNMKSMKVMKKSPMLSFMTLDSFIAFTCYGRTTAVRLRVPSVPRAITIEC